MNDGDEDSKVSEQSAKGYIKIYDATEEELTDLNDYYLHYS